MLDDLKLIHQRDAQDALGFAEKQWQQLSYEYTPFTAGNPDAIDNVVYAGMSGSALAADIVKSGLTISKPLEVMRGYDIPSYVSKNTLFIACSYSGSTEETISAMVQAQAKGAVIVVIASGGKLAEIAQANGYGWVQLPQYGQSRFANGYILKALLTILDAYSFTDNQASRLAEMADWYAAQLVAWRPDVPVAKNKAKALALELLGKSVVVYSGPKFGPAAYRWKTNINENAKQIAWCGQYPEFNHNEFIGWSKQPVQKPYAVIDIRSRLEHERIYQRFEVSERLLSGMRPAPLVIEPVGDDYMGQLLYTIALGDFVSLYLALLNGINPSPLDLVDKLKKELS